MVSEEVIWKGSHDLEPMLVPVDELTIHPNNARQGDVGALSVLLDHHGQVKPIVVQPGDERLVLAGNHTLMAMVELGWTHAAVTLYGGDDPNGFLLADNRSSDLASYDSSILSALVSERAISGTLLGTGYDGDDADQLIADQSLSDDIDDALAGVEKPERATDKDGDSGLTYNMVFSDREQQLVFYDILKWLKSRHPDLDTAADRLVTALQEAREDGSEDDA